MPPAQDGRDRSPTLGAALRPLRDCARDGADEVLSHLPDLGDRELQSAVDAYLDQVADLLREVDASASEVADRLDLATPSKAAPEPTAGPTASAEGRPRASRETAR
ncbi:hypothetical protein [Pedococcus sp. 2YAF34]|uniref:hypothetical protein n=1 Tax=Pedococcus sp. 2YAF34 TaxID=3233032 RepID=UPI003F9716E2